ncbi:hypothetical protein HY837_05685 [archaeon]|nr:hypothetical protein [archaeon]
MKRWLKNLAILGTLGFSTFSPAKAQQDQIKVQNIPSLENCLENDLEFLSSLEENFGETFNTGFAKNDLVYVLNKYPDELVVSIVWTAESDKKHVIHSKGGLFNFVEGEEQINSKTVRQYYGFSLPMLTRNSSRSLEDIPKESPELLSELQQELHQSLIYLFEKSEKSPESLFRPKTMPKDYFNSMNDDVGKMLRIIEKYGEELFEVEHIKVLNFINNGFRYRIEVRQEFFENSAIFKTNKKLREETEIMVEIYNPNITLFNFFMMLDPMNGHIIEYGNKFNEEPFRAKWLYQYEKELNELQSLGEDTQSILDHLKENYSLD